MSKEWAERTMGSLILERPGRSEVLERYGLDYCCGGRESLGPACARKGLPLETVVAELERADLEPDTEDLAWRAGPAAAIENIVSTHHAYTKEALPRLLGLAEKVARVHGEADPRLVTLAEGFRAFAKETAEHMDKEEQILFPMILALDEGKRWAMPPTVQFPIACMLQEHEQHGARLEAFRALTDGFHPPEQACGSWRALLDGLRKLEQDLHRHIHKENTFLFPRAVELERLAS